MDQAEQDAFFLDCMEESIDWIVNGATRDLEDLLELIEAMKGGNSIDVACALDKIERNRYRIFDEGIFHLPHNSLQSEVEKLMDLAHEMADPDEED